MPNSNSIRPLPLVSHADSSNSNGNNSNSNGNNSNGNNNIKSCRLCMGSNLDEPLILPCGCKTHVHGSCLNRWRYFNRSYLDRYWQCEFCGMDYDYPPPALPFVLRCAYRVYRLLGIGVILTLLLMAVIVSAQIIGQKEWRIDGPKEMRGTIVLCILFLEILIWFFLLSVLIPLPRPLVPRTKFHFCKVLFGLVLSGILTLVSTEMMQWSVPVSVFGNVLVIELQAFCLSDAFGIKYVGQWVSKEHT